MHSGQHGLSRDIGQPTASQKILCQAHIDGRRALNSAEKWVGSPHEYQVSLPGFSWRRLPGSATRRRGS